MKRQNIAKKVCFLSWQSDTPSVDFNLLDSALKKSNSGVCSVMLTKRVKKTFAGLLGYYFHMYRQMYHIASSSVLVLDSYVPIVSILNHKEDLYIVQLWHALGAIKKFGYQTVGKSGGRSSNLAKYFNMHRNYSVIISSSAKTSEYYSEAFDYSLDKIHVCGLPRIDYLYNQNKEIKSKILNDYPELDNNKKNILYAPTFRNNSEYKASELIKNFEFEKYNLIFKPHQRQPESEAINSAVVSPKEFSSMELLTVMDYLITDYSAIALEAAVLNVPTLYFLYDYEQYKQENGLNVDIYDILNDKVFVSAEELPKMLNDTTFDGHNVLSNQYLPKELGTSTTCIVDLICKKL